MNVSRSEHAILTRLAKGPATYAQLGEAAGIKADSASTVCRRHLLRYRPVLVTYQGEPGPRGADVLCITPRGVEALKTVEVLERRGRVPLLSDDAVARTAHLSAIDAAATLQVSINTVRRARNRVAGR